MARWTLRWALSVLMLSAGCDAGGLAEGWQRTPPGSGPRIIWDLEAEPLPEIPLPNDIATWPDPTSPTGRRVNASLVAPSSFERGLRESFDRLDGWGTFAPLSVSFDASIDTDALLERQGGLRFAAADFEEHAVYLVDLETGVPVPLDVNSGLFPRTVADPNGYYENDPRAGSSNLLFETVDEDGNANGSLDPGEDTDFDGHLDAPNTLDGALLGAPLETVDRMLWFYERETRTLLLRPIVPLRESQSYAVVITDRLVGEDGQPVRSPFDHVHHVAQRDELASLPEFFAQKPHIYGDLAERGWEGVAFAWTFTTQSTRADLVALREGLYGRGPFARLAEEFPPRLTPAPLRGGVRSSPCDPGERVFVVTPSELAEALRGLPTDGLGVPSAQLDAVVETLERSVSHLAFGFFESPYLLGDPDEETPHDEWSLDRTTGEARIERDLVPMFVIVPRETETRRQPFPVTMYAHGYGSLNIEALAFAGLVASHGIATVSVDAQGHGLPLDETLSSLLEAVLAGSCLAPLGRALSIDRARDLNGDGSADSAGLFFSGYMFHTRDALRQSALDIVQAIRIVRSWQGDPAAPQGRSWEPGDIPAQDGDPIRFDGDVNGDGEVDRAGDFDGDGVPDLGGWDQPYAQWGSSLGGILSMIVAGLEPSVVAAAPVSGGAGLFDVGLRTSLSTARHPVWLRVMGPIIASRPSSGTSDETGCLEGERSIYFELPDLGERVRVEIGCSSQAALAEGDAVVLVNEANGERRCAAVGAEGRFRLQIPASEDDRLSLSVYANGALRLDYATCAFRGEPPPLRDVIDAWRSASGPRAAGRCPRCARYQQRVFEPGSPLVSPIEGLGARRQTPELRRLASLSQIALEPGDPINYARHVFLDPAHAEDVALRGPRSVLVMNVAGDTTVPPSTGNAYARAAGVLPFLPPDAPDELADWRAPAAFSARYGVPSPDDVLVAYHVHEGLPRLERHPVEGAPRFLFDVDDMSGGQQYFAPGANTQLAPEEGGVRPNRLELPLRWGRESRAAGPSLDVWRTRGAFAGHSAVINALAVPLGQHVLLPVDPSKRFDEGEYLINAIGWYLASGGSELAWEVLSDPFCLERSACAYGR